MSLWLPSEFILRKGLLPAALFNSIANLTTQTGMSVLLQQYPDEHERALPRMSETLR